MTRRTAALLAVLGIAAALLAGCGGGSDDGRTVLRYSWWGTPARAALVEQVIARYEATHPGVDIQGSYADYDAYWQKLSTEAAGGGAADVVQMDFSYLREYADRGILLDLTPFVDTELDTATLLPGLAVAGQVDGTTYAIPVSANTFAVAYDTNALAAAGVPTPITSWTWDEFTSAATAATRDGVAGTSDFSGSLYVLQAQLIAQGRAFYTPDGRLDFGADELARFWSEAVPLRGRGVVVAPERAVQVQPATALAAGRTALEFTWDNTLAAIAAQNPSQLGLAPLPSDGGASAQYLKPSQLAAGNAATDHPQQVAEFISFMINDPEVGAILGADRGLPATTVQRAAAELTGTDATIAAFEDSIADRLTAPPPAPPAGAGSLELAFRRLAENVAFARQTPRAAAEEFVTLAGTVLTGSR